MTLKDFKDLKPTPDMVVEQAVNQLWSQVTRGLVTRNVGIRTPHAVECFAAACGRGEQLVKNHPGYRAARWLLS